MSVPNLEKLFQYLQCFSIHPIEFQGQIIGDEIYEIKLNDTLFYTDNCMMCGGCDPAESNVYTATEYKRIVESTEEDFQKAGLDFKYLTKLKDGLCSKELNINNKIIKVWEYKNEHNELYLPTREKVLKRCTWCYQDDTHTFKCRIHSVESITCVMPHLRTYHVKGSHRASLGIYQFGRNWALKCPVVLQPPHDEVEFEHNKASVIAKLEHLHQVGADLNISTRIPEVIDVIHQQKFEKYTGVAIPFYHQPKKLF